jgi:predicted anti-sigma-YlaC factor YlaD
MAHILEPPFERRAAVEFKYLVIVILALILISLGKALFHLSSSKPGDSAKMVKALSWRIALSVLLFVLLLVAYTRGWIVPQQVR